MSKSSSKNIRERRAESGKRRTHHRQVASDARHPKPGPKVPASLRNIQLATYAALIIAVLIVYWQVWGFGFIMMDDEPYVTANPWVRLGLGEQSIGWAFTHFHSANWHPLTWMSHALDVTMHGLNPGGHHFTSVLFHVANTILLLLALNLMTGRFWLSAFVAALFALHPLHVESVAWISERKDVLSTFFLMLTLLTYRWYAHRPSMLRYATVFIALALGLMSKPMLVSVPLILLMLDYWPLGRVRSDKPAKWIWRGLIVEKLPLFALSVTSCVVTFLAQRGQGAFNAMTYLSIGIRAANALVSYMSYILKMLWPSKLAVYYPHPSTHLPVWEVVLCAVALGGITYLAVRAARKRPYLTIGWLWYMVTLIPVIGIVQVGEQAMADRYTYIPLIGLFIMIAWGIPDLLARWSPRPRVALLGVLGIASVVVLSLVTYRQAGYWYSEIELLEHTLAVTSRNALAHNNLGRKLFDQKSLEEAEAHYREALRIEPRYALAHANLAATLTEQGRFKEAEKQARYALRLCPNYQGAYVNLAVSKLMQGKLNDAVPLLVRAVQLDPTDAAAQNNLGVIFAQRGDLDRAIEHFSLAVRYNPEDVSSIKNLEQAEAMRRSKN